MKELKVTDNYRTNPMSFKPGGREVTVVYESGKRFVYDKIKIPGSYIKGIMSVDKGYGQITEILLDSISVWKIGSEKAPWQI